MNGYYFLITSLPSLKFGEKADLSYEDLDELVDENVNESDREKVTLFKQYIDIKNLRLLWMDLPIDPRGNLNRKELEASLLIQDFFPAFVHEFLQTHEENAYRLNHFLFLIANFLQYQIEKQTGFLQTFFCFERDIQILLTALRAKHEGKDLSYELQYEDPREYLVRAILSGKEQATYEPPEEYRELANLYMEHREDPKNLFFAFSEYRFRKIGEMKKIDPFSIDSVLAYMARMLLVEDWALLDPEKGKAMIQAF
jgi:hypothetical protein